jgi:allantoinase
MSGFDFLLRSRKIVTPHGLVDGAVAVKEGRIAAVLERAHVPDGGAEFDLENAAILPGLVDTHAHINEPGRTEWEGFETATQAAAAGGITTVIDMPLNSIPATTTLSALHLKAGEANRRCWIDFGFWGGVVPGNAWELAPMIDAGALGFKAFLCESGVDEFKMSREEDLREAMPILARRGVPLLAHAELETPAPAAGRSYASYLASRPREWENAAVRLLIGLSRETGCRVHIVHLSSSGALDELARARAEGVPITAETCPHYLTFSSEEIRDGATEFKCAPPIRERENREKLWEAVRSGLISFVVSDHSPCTPSLKEGDFARAWGGIASLQLSLSATWTGMRERSMGLGDLARAMAEAPARFAGLGGRKGAIVAGHDADLVVFDEDAELSVDPAMIRHRHKLTPYAGRKLRGRVRMTFLRGRKIFEDGRFLGGPSGHPVHHHTPGRPD